MSLVDYETVTEVKDLPVSWISCAGRDIRKIGNYERWYKQRGKCPNPEKLAELLGDTKVHLRLHILKNGLRYVTLHREDGKEVYDDREYKGLSSCCCGAIKDEPSTASATYSSKNKTNLGEGFKLIGVTAFGHPRRRGAPQSNVCKNYKVKDDNVEVEARYLLRPDYNGDGGQLVFNFRRQRFKNVYQPVADKKGKAKQCLFRKNSIGMGIELREMDKKMGCEGGSYIHIARNLSYFDDWEQLTFHFDGEGKLKVIAGVSLGDNPKSTLKILGVEGNSRFEFDSGGYQTKVAGGLAFGKDVAKLRHDPKRTLDNLIDAAIKEQDIELSKTICFT